MNHIIPYTPEDLKQHTRWRWGETKLGQSLATLEAGSDLKEHPAHYVLLGIPEDIGVRANYGRAGTAGAWKAFMDAFCNLQHNRYVDPDNILVLGTIACTDLMAEAAELQTDDPFFPTKIGGIIKELDERVSDCIQAIVGLDKIPIVIGGGHNNAFGMLKGSSMALDQPIHCVNIDAHTDFRPTEHRHSGNGFSYARETGHLGRYYMHGLHKNYTSEAIWKSLDEDAQCAYSLFDSWIGMNPEQQQAEWHKQLKWISTSAFGLELDLDSIGLMGSSAMSPTGLTLEEVRALLQQVRSKKHWCYAHLCEGAPKHELFPGQVGKALAVLVSDLLKTE